MSGQTIFEPPIILNNCLGTEKNEITFETSVRPKLNDIFSNIITREEAETLAKCAILSDAELIDYHLRHYSEEKIGFLGTHLCLILVAKIPGQNEVETRSFFVKTIPYDVPAQAAYIEEKGCFQKESGFFRYLVPLLTNNYKGESWTPRCYLAKKNTLVFEDMKFKGFSNRSRMFDKKTMKSAVACIARFHAASLIAEERLNGKSLNEIYPDILQESEFKRTGRSYKWYETAINLAISIAQELGLDYTSIKRASERIFDICQPSANKRNVVSHGDLWSSNMIFHNAGHCNLVDFQLVRYAPLAHDLMQLLYLTSTRDFREKYESQIIEYYHMILKSNLAENNFEGTVPSYEELLQGVEEQRLPALITAMIFHPTVLMDGKVAAVIMNDPETYEAYYFVDRKPFVDEIMTKDLEYEKNIKDIVKELTEMSLIVDSLPRPT